MFSFQTPHSIPTHPRSCCSCQRYCPLAFWPLSCLLPLLITTVFIVVVRFYHGNLEENCRACSREVNSSYWELGILLRWLALPGNSTQCSLCSARLFPVLLLPSSRFWMLGCFCPHIWTGSWEDPLTLLLPHNKAHLLHNRLTSVKRIVLCLWHHSFETSGSFWSKNFHDNVQYIITWPHEKTSVGTVWLDIRLTQEWGKLATLPGDVQTCFKAAITLTYQKRHTLIGALSLNGFQPIANAKFRAKYALQF